MMRPILIAASAALLLAACSPQYKAPKMTPEESQRIEQLTEHMTTRCVGRYLIDLPEAFVLGYGNGVHIEGIPITMTSMTRRVFDNWLEWRTQELQTVQVSDQGRAFLRGFEPTPPEFVGKIFNRLEIRGGAEIARVLELMAWKDGYRINMQIKAMDGRNVQIDPKTIGTVWEASERRIVEEDKNRNDTPQKLAQLLSVYARVEGRKEGDIPEGQGLCIDNGFIRGAAIIEETLATSFDLKDAPDVSFTFTADGDVHEKDSMLDRSGQIEKDLKAANGQTIRKGIQQIHGESYEEWLMHGPTPSRVPGTLFTLNAHEVAKGDFDAAKPFVSLVLSNGDRISQPPDLSDSEKEKRGLYKDLERATLSPAEAVALWDKVIPTLRRRPGAF